MNNSTLPNTQLRHPLPSSPGHEYAWLMALIVLTQRAYTLATSCTLAEHNRRPDHKPCLSLAQALLQKGYTSLEAAAQQPAAEQDILIAKKQLLALVGSPIPDTYLVHSKKTLLKSPW